MTREETSGKASPDRGALFFTSPHDNGEPEFDLAELILRLVDHIKLIIFFALTGAALITAPWETLSVAAIIYLLLIPFSMLSYARVRRQRAAQQDEPAPRR